MGGSVRDLLLGRRPKDFDIGTDAHPYQIKRLFRNCWIIGRRFRLAHIKFGLKTIEVATFRKNVADLPAGPPEAPEPALGPDESIVVAAAGPDGFAAVDGIAADVSTIAVEAKSAPALADPVHRDNTFGTTEEDAFRRDFTVNALFYDAATKSIIDTSAASGISSSGSFDRSAIRACASSKIPCACCAPPCSARGSSFELDALVVDAIAELRHLITKASPARLLEEYFKILRSGYAEASFRALGADRPARADDAGAEVAARCIVGARSRASIAIDGSFRRRRRSLTTPMLIGALLHPIGALNRPHARSRIASGDGEYTERVSFGALPVARKDLDRLRQLLQTLPRLLDPQLPPRVARGLPHRPSFADAVTWLEVFGDDPAAVESWKAIRAALPPRPHGPAHGHSRGHGPAHTPATAPQGAQTPGQSADRPKRRRRRRRGRRSTNNSTTNN